MVNMVAGAITNIIPKEFDSVRRKIKTATAVG